MRWVGLALAAVMLLVVAGCGQTPVEKLHASEVAWFDGDVKEAFRVAEQQGKPLFLYWGAEWCPPCNYLKTKIFKRPDFVAKSTEFVTVYLDGDTERAQILGEELGVVGYPTVIIFNPQGEEVMRMPTNVSGEQYVSLLDLALKKMQPVREILDATLAAGPSNAPAVDLNLLAFYSWDQDQRLGLSEEQLYQTFRTLHEQTPATLPLERSRFLALMLESAAGLARSAEGDESAPLLSADERAACHAEVVSLLGDPELRVANQGFVCYFSGEVVKLLHPEPSPEREALIDAWERAALALEQDEELSVDDRLTAITPRITLAALRAGAGADDAEPPPASEELKQHVRERVAWAVDAVADDVELQAAMSTMAYLLEEVDLGNEAEQLLEAKLDDAHAPYYFMSWVAGMKSDADQVDEAIAWYRKAYDSSRGRYSRFRWGSTYLRRVIDLTPDDVATIDAGSFEILGELLTFDDAFAGGNYMRLGQLESAYQKWNEDGGHDELVSRIRDFVRAECPRYPAEGEDSQQVRCSSFLEQIRPA